VTTAYFLFAAGAKNYRNNIKERDDVFNHLLMVLGKNKIAKRLVNTGKEIFFSAGQTRHFRTKKTRHEFSYLR
jgi:hypothetical protein